MAFATGCLGRRPKALARRVCSHFRLTDRALAELIHSKFRTPWHCSGASRTMVAWSGSRVFHRILARWRRRSLASGPYGSAYLQDEGVGGPQESRREGGAEKGGVCNFTRTTAEMPGLVCINPGSCLKSWQKHFRARGVRIPTLLVELVCILMF